MKGSNDLVEQHLEQMWSDDRVVHREMIQQLHDDCSMLAACEHKLAHDEFNNGLEGEDYWNRLDQYSTTT